MLGKLLKYDFRSMLKQFAFVWPAALVLALVNRFLLVLNIEDASQLGATVNVVTIMVYGAILIAMFVLSVVFVIQRFYKGLLGDEGYLMHTLPVRPWQLISSKLICAVVVTLISVLVAVLSILLMIPFGFSEFQSLWEKLTSIIRSAGFLWSLVELLLCILLDMACGFLMLYLAMAIGHLFNKHRISWSVAAYIVVNMVSSLLTERLCRVITPVQYSTTFGLVSGALVFKEISPTPAAEFWLSLAVSAALAAVYFFITSFILKYKLNLE